MVCGPAHSIKLSHCYAPNIFVVVCSRKELSLFRLDFKFIVGMFGLNDAILAIRIDVCLGCCWLVGAHLDGLLVWLWMVLFAFVLEDFLTSSSTLN